MAFNDSNLNEYTEGGHTVSRSVKKHTKAFALCLQFVWTQVTKNVFPGKRTVLRSFEFSLLRSSQAQEHINGIKMLEMFVESIQDFSCHLNLSNGIRNSRAFLRLRLLQMPLMRMLKFCQPHLKKQEVLVLSANMCEPLAQYQKPLMASSLSVL